MKNYNPDQLSSLAANLSMPVEEAAKRLLGATLIRTVDNQELAVRIVEVEAYDEPDPASHSFSGNKGRSSVMFEGAGRAYVYLIYGMYHCLNVVTGKEGAGEAVLIRAVEPIDPAVLDATNGPGKLCRTLEIDRSLNGHKLDRQPLRLILQDPIDSSEIIETTRIGLKSGLEALRRYYIKDSARVSRR